MVSIQTYEQLMNFIQSGMFRFNKNDLRFIHNLQLITLSNKVLTTNQIMLFEKIIKKYHRQLNKHGITEEKIKKLKWETPIVPSDPQYTEAHISILENKIIFRSPFSRKFLEKFNKEKYNPYTWNRTTKQYVSAYSTDALKFILRISKPHFTKINYCPITALLLQEVNKYQTTYWNPTLVKCNFGYTIAAINNKLSEVISKINLSADPEILALLAVYGVSIDDRIINNDPLLKFAASYISEVDYMNVDIVIDYIKKIGCVNVLPLGYGMSRQYKKILIEKCKEQNINIHENTESIPELAEKADTILICFSNEISLHHHGFKKIIIMRNSIPIKIT